MTSLTGLPPITTVKLVKVKILWFDAEVIALRPVPSLVTIQTLSKPQASLCFVKDAMPTYLGPTSGLLWAIHRGNDGVSHRRTELSSELGVGEQKHLVIMAFPTHHPWTTAPHKVHP